MAKGTDKHFSLYGAILNLSYKGIIYIEKNGSEENIPFNSSKKGNKIALSLKSDAFILDLIKYHQISKDDLYEEINKDKNILGGAENTANLNGKFIIEDKSKVEFLCVNGDDVNGDKFEAFNYEVKTIQNMNVIDNVACFKIKKRSYITTKDGFTIEYSPEYYPNKAKGYSEENGVIKKGKKIVYPIQKIEKIDPSIEAALNEHDENDNAVLEEGNTTESTGATDVKDPTSKDTSDLIKNVKHIQKIIFGPPGTGKSQSVKNLSFESRVITAFHPEYTYSDFVAKLMPISIDGKIEYQVIAGHFIKALSKALKNKEIQVLLQIEEINRGNCAAIFGDIFQLLDRDEKGNSAYRVNLSELALKSLKRELQDDSILNEIRKEGAYIPTNLSIIATMNTSDESVYFMDSAFKRRWHFEYLGADHGADHPDVKEQADAIVNYKNEKEDSTITWNLLRQSINNFMKANVRSIRGIEDKQIGLWFIKAEKGEIKPEDIQYKLMHYLWDNVFSRDKRPLTHSENNGLGLDNLVTFGDFVNKQDKFIHLILEKRPSNTKDKIDQQSAT